MSVNNTSANSLYIAKAKVEKVLNEGVDFPIGEILLNISDKGEKNLIKVYYHKTTVAGLKKNTKLAKLYLSPIDVPKEFQFVHVAQTAGKKMTISGHEILHASVKEGKFIKDFEKKPKDLNGFILLDYLVDEVPINTVYSLIKDSKVLKASAKREFEKILPVTLTKRNQAFDRNLLAKISTQNFSNNELKFVVGTLFSAMFNMEAPPIKEINTSFINPLKGKNIGEIFDDMLPDIKPFEDDWSIVANAGPTECPRPTFRVPSNSSLLSDLLTGSRNKGESNANSNLQMFFKFRKHYFVPLSLSNGNNFFYAFENKEILKHFYFMHTTRDLNKFSVASFSPVYSENIFGISICKNVQIIPKGATHQEFWQ